MEPQIIINLLAGLVAFFFGWWMKTLSETMKDLQDADRKLAEKVSNIEILVAGAYVKREDFDKALEKISQKLDRIEDKLSDKVDKREAH